MVKIIRVALLVAIVLAFGLAAIFLIRQTRTGGSNAPTARNGDGLDISVLEKELATLRQEVASLRVQRSMAARQDNLDVDKGPPSVPIDTGPPTADEIAQIEHRRARRYEQQLDANFQQEHRDPSWASETEQKIQNIVASGIPTDKVERATCAASLCQVVLRHEDQSSQRELAHFIAAKEPFKSGTTYFYDGNVTTLYVTRENVLFPAPTP